MSDRKEIVIVLGMHRSGTSGITNYIAQLGYDPGNNLMAANHDNVKGYYEDIDIYNFNEEILDYLGLTWQDIEHNTFRKINLLYSIIWDKFGERGIAILNQKLKKSDRIVIKDPRFCILLTIWEKIFTEINASVFRVFVLRNPLDVMKSLQHRNGFSKDKANKLWFYYNISCIKDSKKELHIINFEDFVDNKSNLFEKLSKFSSKHQLINPVKDVLDKKMIHHNSTVLENQEFGKENPQIISFYSEISSNRIINSDIDYTKYEYYSNPLLNKNIEKLISNLFTHLKSNNTLNKPSPIQYIHKAGEQILQFDIQKNTTADTFNIFLCDKPIILHLKSIEVISNGEVLAIDQYSGNYILNEQNKLLFNTNKPKLIFELDSPMLIQKINVDCVIIDDTSFINNIISIIDKHIKISDLFDGKGFSTLFYEQLNTINSKIDNTQAKLVNHITNKIESQYGEVIEKTLHFFQSQIDEINTLNKDQFDQNRILIQELKNGFLIEKEKSVNLHKENKNLTKQIYEIAASLKVEKYKNADILDRKKALKVDYHVLLNDYDLLKSKLEESNNNYKIVQAQLKEEIKKSKYLYSLKLAHDLKAYGLKQKEADLDADLKKVYNSYSWKLTYPLRKFYEYLFIKPKRLKTILSKELKFGIEHLRKKGVVSFFNRLYWYIRGYRLKIEIDKKKNKRNVYNSTKSSSDITTIIELPKYSTPLVSIIIPVYNQWEYTYKCIKSIYENTLGVPYEIIVADDVSDDETIYIKKTIKNLIVVRNKKNLKFVLNNNNAAKYAKGKYIHFLNNDTLVHPNWLTSLLEILEKDKNAGIVGSKLVYPDGKLQEAGGIIWNDASGWNYGRLDDPDKPEYNYLRETDYISGASFLIKKEIWEELNGFDELFIPAYYEDTDLAFRARAKGYKVIYQPLSIVTHFEGISNGKNLNEGLKKYQVENAQKFKHRWKQTLEKEQSANAVDVFLAKDRSFHKKQVLVIDHYVPHFDKDAGSRSTYNYLLLLVKMGFKVTFIGDNFFKHEPYTQILQQTGIEVLYGNFYYKNIQNWLQENGRYFNFAILHRIHIAPKYIPVLKKYSKAKLFYVGHDLEFLSSQRKYELTKDKKHLTDSKKFQTTEFEIFNSVDTILPFSTYEASYIEKLVPHKSIQTIPVYFYEKVTKLSRAYNNRDHLLFVAGFGHPPNVDAAIWLAKDIFPLISKKLPHLKLFIVGSNPTAEIKDLTNENIIVTGYVDDKTLKDFYYKSRVAVLPLRFGAGVKGKLIESCYYQIPSVITTVASEGVPDIEKYAIIEDTAEAFAEKVIDLYNNSTLWHEQSKKCREIIQNHYTEESIISIFKRHFK